MEAMRKLSPGVLTFLFGIQGVWAQTDAHSSFSGIGGSVSNPNGIQAKAQQDIANDLQKAEQNLRTQQEIQSINNSFNESIGGMNTSIAQANFQKSQCDTQYQQEVAEADQQAEQQKGQALGNMMGQAMGPITEGLGQLTNKEQENQKKSMEAQVQSYDEAVKLAFKQNPQLEQSAPKENFMRNGDLSARNFPFANLECTGGQRATDVAGLQASNDTEKKCERAIENLKVSNDQLNQQLARFGIDDKAANSTLGAIAAMAIPLGAGLFGYSTAKKGADSGAESRKETAAAVRDACKQQADIQLNDLHRQLAALQKQKGESLAAAQEAARLAGMALDANLAAQSLNNDTPASDPRAFKGLPIDPNSLLGDTKTSPGPTIGDPVVPLGNGSNNLAGGGGAGSGSGQGATGGGGGGGGGTGGGGGGGTNWTFGSSYPPFAGGGGLPQQPEKGKWKGGGGGGGGGSFLGGFGGFANSQDAFNSFGGQDNSGSGPQRGDGGLLVMLQRARLRLSAHSSELLTDNHIKILARKDAKESAPNTDSKVSRATASRLR